MLYLEIQPPLCYNLSMSVFTSLGILILAVLISSFLMLIPGIFANFFHYASGKYTRTKADSLSLFFILGTETMVVLGLFLIATIIWALPPSTVNLENPILVWILAGIFFGLSLTAFFVYFRKNGQLFISRKTATTLIDRPKSIKNSSDAFVFGLMSGIPELPFTLPLYFVSILAISNVSLSPFPCAGLIIFYAILAICPLFATHLYFRTGHNLADFLRHRLKNQTFFRIFLGLLYFILATLLIGGLIL